MEPVSKNWYSEVELFHGTVSWVSLIDSFVLTFSINEVCPALDAAIRLIHTKVFDDKEIVEYQPDWKEQEANVSEILYSGNLICPLSNTTVFTRIGFTNWDL